MHIFLISLSAYSLVSLAVAFAFSSVFGASCEATGVGAEDVSASLVAGFFDLLLVALLLPTFTVPVFRFKVPETVSTESSVGVSAISVCDDVTFICEISEVLFALILGKPTSLCCKVSIRFLDVAASFILFALSDKFSIEFFSNSFSSSALLGSSPILLAISSVFGRFSCEIVWFRLLCELFSLDSFCERSLMLDIGFSCRNWAKFIAAAVLVPSNVTPNNNLALLVLSIPPLTIGKSSSCSFEVFLSA